MEPITCPACGYEFDTPAPSPDGPGCPRCGEPAGAPGERPGPGVETFLGAVLGGTTLGLLTAAILILGRG